jgi:hypothetical protein
MRKPWTPSIVPRGDDRDVYLVVEDLGRLGRVWREADYEATDYETVVADLLDGQYGFAVDVFCFNPAEGWSRNVSEDIARELERRCDLERREPSPGMAEFIERHRGPARQLTLRLG